MRILGIDYGDSRVGIAVSDPLGFTAQGVKTLKNKNKKKLLAELTEIINEYNPETIIIGKPKNMDGSEGFRVDATYKFAEDLGKMQIEASVVESDIARVKTGQKVEFSVDSFPDEIFIGTVTQVRNEAITTSNVVTYEVIIEVDNKDLKLKPGMTANVEIITADKNNILVVPNKALRFYITDETGKAPRYKDKGIWLLKNGQPKRVAVKVGISDDENSEIISDIIKAGDEVILEKIESNDNNSPAMRMRMPR